MVYLLYGLLVFMAFVLQSAIIPCSLFYNIIPDLLLIIITLLAIYRGKTVGGALGFFTGLLQDWFSGGLFGINAISKAIVGYLFGFLKDHIYPQNIIVPPVGVAIATIINQLLIISFTDYLLTELSIEVVLRSVIIPLVIYNSILSVILNILIYKINNYLARRKFID
ncbi:rod shape-determining protein MreD [Orenia metallireducens]|uniref:Rod shape-determining protein MreD n=1 Tax=Orenia metallireducens TaxID=1413210 RepID=A0A1C0A558_9FIRM|nr:rod shape-determining protein MreD [Orenia metallireducens]OCL25271.1 rod shape-determining protein MreD [Orenia metallireducens]